ncbi:hypothetical protein ABT288_38435 [Streptomyces sp. NPDC001093]|uniref:hypothetical protein n=1 Tax=Streptomyces sp. NPDC001093 TaxID=3154376 RepID=UPI00331CF272
MTFRDTAVLVPVQDQGWLTVDFGGIRWIFAFSHEPALARYALARDRGDEEWTYETALGARLLDASVPQAGVPCGVALDVADGEERAVQFPPVAGIATVVVPKDDTAPFGLSDSALWAWLARRDAGEDSDSEPAHTARSRAWTPSRLCRSVPTPWSGPAGTDGRGREAVGWPMNAVRQQDGVMVIDGSAIQPVSFRADGRPRPTRSQRGLGLNRARNTPGVSDGFAETLATIVRDSHQMKMRGWHSCQLRTSAHGGLPDRGRGKSSKGSSLDGDEKGGGGGR